MWGRIPYWVAISTVPFGPLFAEPIASERSLLVVTSDHYLWNYLPELAVLAFGFLALGAIDAVLGVKNNAMVDHGFVRGIHFAFACGVLFCCVMLMLSVCGKYFVMKTDIDSVELRGERLDFLKNALLAGLLLSFGGFVLKESAKV